MEKNCWNCSHCFYLRKEKHDCYDVNLYLCEDKNEILDEFYVDYGSCKNFSYSENDCPENYYKTKKKL